MRNHRTAVMEDLAVVSAARGRKSLAKAAKRDFMERKEKAAAVAG